MKKPVFLCLFLALPVALFAQDAGDVDDAREEAPVVQGARVKGFQLPAEENTYVVTYNLKGLRCVKDLGTPTQCAVTNSSADEGGYPWTKVKCRQGDPGVSTFAWSLDLNKPMGIYEAPPSLTTDAETYTVNVRLGRVCMKK